MQWQQEQTCLKSQTVLALSSAVEPWLYAFLGCTDTQTHVIISFFFFAHVIIAFIVTSLCHQCLLSQAVLKKKKDSGRKVLAKIFTQILADCKKADGLTDIWWKVFSVSFICCSCHM